MQSAEHQVCERVDRLPVDEALCNRHLEKLLQAPEIVALIELPPPLGPEDSRPVDNDDLLHCRIEAAVEKGRSACRHCPPWIALGGRGRCCSGREPPLLLVEDGEEEVLLVAKVMVKRAARHPGLPHDLLGRCRAIAELREQPARHPHQGLAGRGRAFGLSISR